MIARLPLVSPVERALFLKAQEYLEGVSSSVLAALASYTEERVYHAGELIRKEGGSLDRIIFLGQGTVQVEFASGAGGAVREIQAPGAIGLAHHFAGAGNPPRIRALTDALCLEMRADDLDQILEDHFSLLIQMCRTSCHHAVESAKALREKRPDLQGFVESASAQTPIDLDLVARLARLKQAPFWAETNLGVLAELVRREPPQKIDAGQALWQEGESIDRMVVVLDGRFRSCGRYGQVNASSGATLGAYELFLEGDRFEGWIAEVPSRVIPIPRDLFIDLLEDHFEFAQGFLSLASSYIIECWAIAGERAAAKT